jgi:protein-S-isoprenylcysteine O-methyltransferase Ste14
VILLGDSESSRLRHNNERMKRIKESVTGAVAYFMPLVMSAPGFYMGLMTVPFLVYLITVIIGLPTTQEPVAYLLLGGSPLDNGLLSLSLAFLLYSVVFLWHKKSKGLVTTGPYRVVRHPQYLGLIVFTAVLTSRSVWILQNTFGIGLFSVPETIAIWFLMVFVYVGLAVFEERHLSIVFKDKWPDYIMGTGFLMPFVASQRRWLEIVVSVLLFAGLLFSLLSFSSSLMPV